MEPSSRVQRPAAIPLAQLESASLAAPGMLLVGATGRNNGKTEFVCSLLRRYAGTLPISAAKVTTVSHGGSGCPRGGEGCGVCASLEEPFRVTREVGGPDGKDTVRMQLAGADPVMWLRARRDALALGAAQLLPKLGPVCIAESNRLRTCVEPDLFLLIRGSPDEAPKESAAEVLDLADRIVYSDGHSFDPPAVDVSLVHGRWAIRRHAAAIIMAGGEGSRMGANKALAMAPSGIPMIEQIMRELRPHVRQILISTNEPEHFSFLGLPMIPDEVRECGPLMGLASTLARSPYDLNLVVSCDLPRINTSIVNWLFRHIGDHDVCIPETADGRFHPLFALYRKGVEPMARQALQAGQRRVVAMLEHGAQIRFLQIGDVVVGDSNTIDGI